jgi:hypothetical protein
MPHNKFLLIYILLICVYGESWPIDIFYLSFKNIFNTKHIIYAEFWVNRFLLFCLWFYLLDTYPLTTCCLVWLFFIFTYIGTSVYVLLLYSICPILCICCLSLLTHVADTHFHCCIIFPYTNFLPVHYWMAFHFEGCRGKIYFSVQTAYFVLFSTRMIISL